MVNFRRFAVLGLFIAITTGDLFAGRNVVAPSRKASTGTWFKAPSAPSRVSTPSPSRTTYTTPTFKSAPAPTVVQTPVKKATPPTTTVGLGASQALKRQESAVAYNAYKAEKASPPPAPVQKPQPQTVVSTPVYSRPVVNQPVTVNHTVVNKVQYNNYGYNPNSWASTHQSYYSRYYSPTYRPRYVLHTYSDPIDLYFWYSLLDMTADAQARWVYNHQAQLDAQRIADLRASNAAFAVAYQNLAAQKAAQDLNYQPPGVPASQVYNEAYLKRQAELAGAQKANDKAAVAQQASQQTATPAYVPPVVPVVNTVPASQPVTQNNGNSGVNLLVVLVLVVLVLGLGFVRVW